MKTDFKSISNSLESTWEALLSESEKSNKKGIFIRRIIPESKSDLFLGIEKPLNSRLFILKAEKKACEVIKNFPESKGLSVKSIVLPHESSNKEAIIVILKDTKYADIFSSLVTDIAYTVLDFQDDHKAVKALISRLKKWQQFMEQNTAGVLSDEAVRGLFGELSFIYNLVIPRLSPANVFSWKGFQNTNQDFYFTSAAVEIKTTLGREPRSISIASERQLDKLGYPHLFIYHISLDRSETAGISLPEIINSIRDLLKNFDEELNYFENSLLSAGYIDAYADRYKNKFVIRNTDFYEVTESFPKILENDLRNGVGNVRYEISISECRHFVIDSQKVVRILKGDKNG